MQEVPMHPISQIELKTHLNDLERQVASARRSQASLLGWLVRLWRSRRSAGRDATGQGSIHSQANSRLPPSPGRSAAQDAPGEGPRVPAGAAP